MEGDRCLFQTWASALRIYMVGEICCFRENGSLICVFYSNAVGVLTLQPFGVNQPGPYVSYTTVDSNGYLKNASGKSNVDRCCVQLTVCQPSLYRHSGNGADLVSRQP